MPHFIRGRKVKSAKLKRSSEESRKRRRILSSLNYDLYKWIRTVSYVSVLVMAVFTLAVVLAFNHYRLYPGRVERDSICSPGSSADSIMLSWDETHNTDVYKVYYKEHDRSTEKQKQEAVEAEKNGTDKTIIDDSWTEIETADPVITVQDLKENTSYSFIVRADNAKKEGIATEPRNFKTKRSQSIEVDKMVTKFTASEPFKLGAEAETDLVYESSDPDIAEVDPVTGLITTKSEGETEISVRATTTGEYEGDHEVVDLKVLDCEPVDADGASMRTIYHLDSDNCEIVKRVTGAAGASVPQGLAYTGDKYIISYGMGSPNRIISFDVDGDGKEISVPKVSLGHPNGFTYADENAMCYCARGWTSKVSTFEPTSDSYGSVGLSYGCSGIGYDRKEKLLYTCSRTAMVAYDISDGYSIKYRTGVVKHSGTVYTQDCGGHAGIMFRCLSGSSKHGINYIDLYHMKSGRYLGTITCDLSEVESCIIDKDGFLEILSNNTSNVDYIWKTDLNIDTLGEGL